MAFLPDFPLPRPDIFVKDCEARETTTSGQCAFSRGGDDGDATSAKTINARARTLCVV